MPRLWCPDGSRCSTAASAAASIRLIITGVARTAIRPDPTKGAVCSGPTTISAVPVRPGTIRSNKLRTVLGEVIRLYSVNPLDRAKRLLPLCYHGDTTVPGVSMSRYALVAAALIVAVSAGPCFAVDAKQKMATCKFGADDQRLQGAARDAFLKKCMANRVDPRGPGSGAAAGPKQ